MDQDKISKLIKTIREENNLTQKELGDSLGVSYQAVSKWENGKNIPDIALLKEISDKYNIDINDLLEGNNKKKEKSKFPIVITICLLLILIILVIILLLPRNKINFKQLGSNCSSFDIKGTIAYNSDTTSLSISDIEYCGDSVKLYESLKCTLYENDKIITTCKEEHNMNIKDYLSGVRLNVDNYKQSCKLYKDNDLKLIIEVYENTNKINFEVPLKLNDNC